MFPTLDRSMKEQPSRSCAAPEVEDRHPSSNGGTAPNSYPVPFPVVNLLGFRFGYHFKILYNFPYHALV